MSSHGQKVTTDPRSKIPIQEGAGIITSDSLAAESLATNGTFGAGNPSAVASQQPSSSTTTNTTDTSNATRLEPAPDAEAREAAEGWSESASLNAGRGLESSSTSYGNADAAPSAAYAGAGLQEADLKPKGKNISEGGFDDGAPNASFNQEVGTKKDPGRVAEAKFELSGFGRGDGKAGGGDVGGFGALDASERT